MPNLIYMCKLFYQHSVYSAEDSPKI